MFSRYFFTSSLEYWEFEWNKEAHKVGYPLGDPNADHVVKPHVVDFTLGAFPMAFKPWFWSLLAAGLLIVDWRRRGLQTEADASLGSNGTDGHLGEGGSEPRPGPDFRAEITMLATSELCSIVGYFPIVLTNHFRYTFWPTLAVTMAIVLWAAMRPWSRTRRNATPGTRVFSEHGAEPTRLGGSYE